LFISFCRCFELAVGVVHIDVGCKVFCARRPGTKSENLDIIVNNGIRSLFFGAECGPGTFEAV